MLGELRFGAQVVGRDGEVRRMIGRAKTRLRKAYVAAQIWACHTRSQATPKRSGGGSRRAAGFPSPFDFNAPVLSLSVYTSLLGQNADERELVPTGFLQLIIARAFLQGCI
jgi:hypothetical protein